MLWPQGRCKVLNSFVIYFGPFLPQPLKKRIIMICPSFFFLEVTELEEGEQLELAPRPSVVTKTDQKYETEYTSKEELGK